MTNIYVDKRYISDPANNERHISIRQRTPGGRWMPFNTNEVSRAVSIGYVVFRIDAPRPGLWTIEVSTENRAHTRYTAGGFV